MLLCDGYIEITVREALRELNEARAFTHCGRNADDFWIALGHVAQPLAENLRVRRARALFLEDRAAFGIERAWAMPLDRIRLGGRVALTLACDDVQELRSAQASQIA